MKRIISSLLVFLILCCFGCGGDISKVRILETPSSIYTSEEIQSAIDAAIRYFRKEFDGCTLTEIGYIGDERMEDSGGSSLVLISSFDVDASGGDGSLEPCSTYRNRQWIFRKNVSGIWEHIGHGY